MINEKGMKFMKKILNKFIVVCSVIILSACATSQETKNENQTNQTTQEIKTTTLKPSDLSDETKTILQMFDDNVAFYDLTLDDTVQSYSMSLWVYKDNQWKEQFQSKDNLDKRNCQIGFSVIGDECYFMIIDGDKKIKVSSQLEKLEFDKNLGSYSQQIDSTVDVKIDQEVLLWIKCAHNSLSVRIPDNFREAECEEGFALTITLSDKTIE